MHVKKREKKKDEEDPNNMSFASFILKLSPVCYECKKREDKKKGKVQQAGLVFLSFILSLNERYCAVVGHVVSISLCVNLGNGYDMQIFIVLVMHFFGTSGTSVVASKSHYSRRNVKLDCERQVGHSISLSFRNQIG